LRFKAAWGSGHLLTAPQVKMHVRVTVSVLISAIALVVSVVVFVDNRVRQSQAARLGRRPMLVFVWDQGQQQWSLDNIGLGPALDVVAVQRISGQWMHPLRMPELAVGDADVIPRRWIEAWDPDPGLAVRYRSVVGEPYSTRTGDDWSQASEGWRDFPAELWQHVEPHWRYRHPAPGSPGGEPHD
jgi:hypothetical protein